MLIQAFCGFVHIVLADFPEYGVSGLVFWMPGLVFGCLDLYLGVWTCMLGLIYFQRDLLSKNVRACILGVWICISSCIYFQRQLLLKVSTFKGTSVYIPIYNIIVGSVQDGRHPPTYNKNKYMYAYSPLCTCFLFVPPSHDFFGAYVHRTLQ